MNLDASPSIKDITTKSSRGWAVSLFEEDGETPLRDHNGNRIPDTGWLNPMGSKTIVVKVMVPNDAPLGAEDMTMVTTGSARNLSPFSDNTAINTTTVNGVLRLSLSASKIDFGPLSPAGTVGPGGPGVSVATDKLGSYYVRQGADGKGALRVTVDSNGPWVGACEAGENTGSAISILTSDSRFEWRLAGARSWTPFATLADGAAYENNCFERRSVGSNNYGYDFRLRVEWTDSPGTFHSDVTFEASQ